MTSQAVGSIVISLVPVVLSVFLPAYIVETTLFHSLINNDLDTDRSKVISGVCLAALFYRLSSWTVVRLQKGRDETSIYGLQHGRLHLQIPTAMWMNMGYWKNSTDSTTLSEACRDLLRKILGEAGLSGDEVREETDGVVQRKRCLLDVGFGCGDQTVYLTSAIPLRHTDEAWWDTTKQCVKFDHYIGITNDVAQMRYASERLSHLQNTDTTRFTKEEHATKPCIKLFCADASKPTDWSQQVHASIEDAMQNAGERWVLGLDTAYHFSPSRRHIIEYSHSHLGASFMAFDLCLSPRATTLQKIMLRVLTTLMGAPWSNFVTPHAYRQTLIDAGYQSDLIKIVDISEHVFSPLASFLGKQDERLRTLGLGLGSLAVARHMFGWWGRTGVVRGVIVVAKQQ